MSATYCRCVSICHIKLLLLHQYYSYWILICYVCILITVCAAVIKILLLLCIIISFKLLLLITLYYILLLLFFTSHTCCLRIQVHCHFSDHIQTPAHQLIPIYIKFFVSRSDQNSANCMGKREIAVEMKSLSCGTAKNKKGLKATAKGFRRAA